MKKSYLYSLDHEAFRSLVGSGERGLAERLIQSHREAGGFSHEADLDDLEEFLLQIERKGSVSATGDRKSDNILNHALWLIAQEAGIDAASGGASVELYRQADGLLSKRGWFSRPLLGGLPSELFHALHCGRVYGSDEDWSSDITTAVLDPSEVKVLLSALRAVAEVRGPKLPAPVQDLLDQHIFPSLEMAARAGLGLLALTKAV